MEEKKENEEKIQKETEKVKKETVDTAKKFKKAIKETNIKEETKITGNFIKDMFKDPIGKIKEVSNDKKSKFLKTTLILMILWVVCIFIESTYTTIYLWGFARVLKNILSVLKNILAPIIGILVYSIIVFVMNSNTKKPLSTIISTVTVTQVPLIFASLICLLNLFSRNILSVTDSVTSLCKIISVVLGFFGFKFLFNEESSKNFFKKYVIIQILYFICSIIISLLEIYI